MTILLFTFLSFLLLHTPAWAEHKGTKLVQRDGVWYYPFHKEPLNGSVGTWYSKGQLKSGVTYKDGKKDGPFTEWNEQGNITK